MVHKYNYKIPVKKANMCTTTRSFLISFKKTLIHIRMCVMCRCSQKPRAGVRGIHELSTMGDRSKFRFFLREQRAISTLNHWVISSTLPYNLVTSLAIQSLISFTPIEYFEFSRIMQSELQFGAFIDSLSYLYMHQWSSPCWWTFVFFLAFKWKR